jgi:hypothetical protein
MFKHNSPENQLAYLFAELHEQMAEAEKLDAAIRQNLEVLGYGGGGEA